MDVDGPELAEAERGKDPGAAVGSRLKGPPRAAAAAKKGRLLLGIFFWGGGLKTKEPALLCPGQSPSAPAFPTRCAMSEGIILELRTLLANRIRTDQRKGSFTQRARELWDSLWVKQVLAVSSEIERAGQMQGGEAQREAPHSQTGSP